MAVARVDNKGRVSVAEVGQGDAGGVQLVGHDGVREEVEVVGGPEGLCPLSQA